jgi:hypothetical protein
MSEECEYALCDRDAVEEWRDGSVWCDEHYIEKVRVAAEAACNG